MKQIFFQDRTWFFPDMTRFALLIEYLTALKSNIVYVIGTDERNINQVDCQGRDS